MKSKKKNTSSETNAGGTSPCSSITDNSSKSSKGVSHTTSSKTPSIADGIGIVCFACCIEHSLEGAVEVLETVIESLPENHSQEAVEEGLNIVLDTLRDLLEEIASRHHGEGLPKGNIPVRAVPYVVTRKQKTQVK